MENKTVQVRDKRFRLYLTSQQIDEAVSRVAEKINAELADIIHQYTMLCASNMGQVAADKALSRAFETNFEDVRQMVRSYDRRRRLMVDGLREMGLPCFEPKGAFYVFPCIAGTGLTSDEFCERLLREKHVAVVPGTAFGESGEGYVRCSYATGIEKLREALLRMGDFVAQFP